MELDEVRTDRCYSEPTDVMSGSGVRWSSSAEAEPVGIVPVQMARAVELTLPFWAARMESELLARQELVAPGQFETTSALEAASPMAAFFRPSMRALASETPVSAVQTTTAQMGNSKSLPTAMAKEHRATVAVQTDFCIREATAVLQAVGTQTIEWQPEATPITSQQMPWRAEERELEVETALAVTHSCEQETGVTKPTPPPRRQSVAVQTPEVDPGPKTERDEGAADMKLFTQPDSEATDQGVQESIARARLEGLALDGAAARILWVDDRLPNMFGALEPSMAAEEWVGPHRFYTGYFDLVFGASAGTVSNAQPSYCTTMGSFFSVCIATNFFCSAQAFFPLTASRIVLSSQFPALN